MITYVKSLKFKFPLFIWSLILPGVPITICTLCLSSLTCSLKGCFPKTAAHLTFFILPILDISSLTCNASSLVGTRTNAVIFPSSTLTSLQIGTPKLAVFPLPVCDFTIISSPSKRLGIVLS